MSDQAEPVTVNVGEPEGDVNIDTNTSNAPEQAEPAPPAESAPSGDQ